MSGDEVLVGLAAGLVAAAHWGAWLTAAFRTSPLARPRWRQAAAGVALLASLGVVAAALVTGADPQVRSSAGYVLLFLAVAVATLALAAATGAGLGLSMLDDFVRGRNRAAGWAAAGLWLGVGLVNAGANVGRGDTIYTTLGPLALGMATLLALVGLAAAATAGFRAVRLDRDGPAGVRLAGLFVAWGLVLGRAVAGDWESARRTWEDFGAFAWPVLLLLAVGIPVERVLRPTVRRPRTTWPMAVVPAAAYVAGAVGWVLAS
jgi:hypothetical protein